MPELSLFVVAASLAFAGQPAPAQGSARADTRTAEAVALQTAVERVCLPLIDGKAVEDVASVVGLRETGGRWSIDLAKEKRITVAPPSPANPHVCSLTIFYEVEGEEPLLELLNEWARSRGLQARKMGEESRGPFRMRKTYTWDGAAGSRSMALVFAQEKELDGSPVGELDEAIVLVSATKR